MCYIYIFFFRSKGDSIRMRSNTSAASRKSKISKLLIAIVCFMTIYFYIVTTVPSNQKSASKFQLNSLSLMRKFAAIPWQNMTTGVDVVASNPDMTDKKYVFATPKTLTVPENGHAETQSTIAQSRGNTLYISEPRPSTRLKEQITDKETKEQNFTNVRNLGDTKRLPTQATFRNVTKENINTLKSAHISITNKQQHIPVSKQQKRWCEDLAFQYPLVLNVSEILQSDGKPLTGVKPIHLHPFRYIYNPENICSDRWNNIRILSVVKSKVTNFAIREAIRKTWGKIASNGPYRMVFTVGYTQNIRTRRQVEVEYAKYGDVIQENFIDSYYNNSLKTIMSIRWIATYCSRADFVLLVDDDVMVNFRNLINHVSVIPHAVADTLYSGNLKTKDGPIRLSSMKWHIPKEEFPYECYPDYISGGAILTSGQVMRKMHLLLPYVKRFKLDDIYLSILAQKLRVYPTHNSKISMRRLKISVLREIICSHGFSKYHAYIDTYSNMMANMSHFSSPSI